MRISAHSTGGHFRLDRRTVLDEDRLTVHDRGELRYDVRVPAATVQRAQQLARTLFAAPGSGEVADVVDAVAVEVHVVDGPDEVSLVAVDGDDLDAELCELLELLDDAVGHLDA
jgi:hypothetical protein